MKKEVASIESDKAECRCLQSPMLARRGELHLFGESSKLTPCALMADPLDSGDDVSTIFRFQISMYLLTLFFS